MQFCKRILGVKKTTQNDFIYGELGRISFKTRRLYNILKYWVKILHTDNNKYIKKVYELLKLDHERMPNKINWCSLVKDLLCSLGFYEAWLYQGIGHVDLFLINIKQRLNDNFVQNWSNRLNDSSRALFYNTIAVFRLQPYLELINIKKCRIELTKLRVSSHRLHIETGRWAKPVSIPVNERICDLCAVLEDEYHFVLQCPLYSDLRKKHIPSYYRTRPNMIKFTELINTENKNQIRQLGKFVLDAFELRKLCFE